MKQTKKWVLLLSLLLAAALIAGCEGTYPGTSVAISPAAVGLPEGFEGVAPDAAKKIALEHAGVTEDQVSYYYYELGFEDGVPVYDIDFWTASGKYDYDIAIADGRVVSYEMEFFAENPLAILPAQPSVPASNAAITPEAAAQAALDHAGVKKEEAFFDRTELDTDHGRLEYEIEFFANGKKYEYDVDAATGAILSFDVDGKTRMASATQPADGKHITEEEARQIALGHAGVNAADAVFEWTERDNEHGRLKYEIEFRSGGMKYEYDIDADTGAVLSFETEGTYQAPAAAPAPAAGGSGITRDQAVEIALKHAGVSRSQTSKLKAELDRDDGRSVYEISFKVGRMEYDYDIDPATGSILKHEKELDD